MNRPLRSPRHPLFIPAWLALASLVGLLSALIGDGGWDVVSWLLFAGLLALLPLLWWRRERKR